MRSYGRLVAVLLLQLGILAAIPVRQVRARLAGTPITLRTAPVDPYDVLSGHYVTLSYEIENAAVGAFEQGLRDGDEVWLTVAHADPAWTLVSVARERPTPSASGQVAIRARWHSGRLGGRGGARLDGARRFYVTQQDRDAVEGSQRRGREQALADLRIHEDGTPAIVALRVDGKVLSDR